METDRPVYSPVRFLFASFSFFCLFMNSTVLPNSLKNLSFLYILLVVSD